MPLIERLCSTLVIGGLGEDVELDEISFRSVGRRRGVVWIRYLAAVRRGFSLVWIDPLPYRISRGDGQGGGGPISIAEMRQHLLLDSDEPVLAVGSVCHTDSAKAYKNLASLLYDGTLMDFEHLKLGHTCVHHKPPRPEFSKEIQTRVWNSNAFEEQIRWGGTQKLDGFLLASEGMLANAP